MDLIDSQGRARHAAAARTAQWTLTVACGVALCLGSCGSTGTAGYGDVGAHLPDMGSMLPGDVAAPFKDVADIGLADHGTAKPDIPVPAQDVAIAAHDAQGLDVSAAADAADTGALCATLSCVQNSDCPSILPEEVTGCLVSLCLEGCCQKVMAQEAAPCDDGNPCTTADTCTAAACVGTAANCDDGLACTDDACDAVQGCTHMLLAGSCLISGVCIADGATSSESLCKHCDAMVNATGWSVAANCCVSAAQCPAPGACDIAQCDLGTGQCSVSKKMGCCATDADCSDGNGCTIDSCDPSTGACSIVPKTCSAPSPCQKGACDAKTGECGGVLKPGYCYIDGACVLDGTGPADGPCKVCAPLQSGTAWTANAGTYCDDGNSCTFSDVCNSAGECKGKAQPGCCKADADCPVASDPCKPTHCNLGAGLCVTVPKSGCCLSGVCCDLGSHTTLAAGSPCSTTVLATEYQCSGTAVQKRDTLPGCDGSSPDGCSTAYSSQGPWVTVQDCAAGTQCAPKGSGIQPTCEAVGSCSGSCGGKSANGNCQCDASCGQLGSCCSDFKALCGCSSGECCDLSASYPKPAGSSCSGAGSVQQYQCAANTLQQRTGTPSCDGANSCSAAPSNLQWSSWSNFQACPVGTTCTSSGGSGACKAPPAGTCLGHCGTKSTASCYCDAACVTLGDCCSDYTSSGCAGVSSCGSTVNSCTGNCGGQSTTSTCWCDTSCDTFGDCCPDKAVCQCY